MSIAGAVFTLFRKDGDIRVSRSKQDRLDSDDMMGKHPSGQNRQKNSLKECFFVLNERK